MAVETIEVAATLLQEGERAKGQRRGVFRIFPGNIVVEKRRLCESQRDGGEEEALRVAERWGKRRGFASRREMVEKEDGCLDRWI